MGAGGVAAKASQAEQRTRGLCGEHSVGLRGHATSGRSAPCQRRAHHCAPVPYEPHVQ